MREYIIADNQDISKAGMMFLLSRQKDVSVLLEADNKAELIQQLRLYPQAVVILDYTLFDFAGAERHRDLKKAGLRELSFPVPISAIRFLPCPRRPYWRHPSRTRPSSVISAT